MQGQVSTNSLAKSTAALAYGLFADPTHVYLQAVLQNIMEYKGGRDRYELMQSTAKSVISAHYEKDDGIIMVKAKQAFEQLERDEYVAAEREYEAIKTQAGVSSIPGLTSASFNSVLSQQQRVFELTSYMGESLLLDHRLTKATNSLAAMSEVMIMIKSMARDVRRKWPVFVPDRKVRLKLGTTALTAFESWWKEEV